MSCDDLHKKCVPCSSLIEPMSAASIQQSLSEIPGWMCSLDGQSIVREVILKNFAAAVDLINHIKDIAELEGHHPDLHLTAYKKLKIVLSTHSIGGLSTNDFVVAEKISKLLEICLK